MRAPEELRARATALFQRHLVAWAVEASHLGDERAQVADTHSGPQQADGHVGAQTTEAARLSLPLQPPTQAVALSAAPEVTVWIAAWRAYERDGAGAVAWEERRWASLGAQLLPVRVVLEGTRAIARDAGQLGRLEEATQCARLLREHAAPAAKPEDVDRALRTVLRAVTDEEPEDFDRLLGLMAWMTSHEVRGQYLREVSVPGLDTKWLERHQRIVAGLLPLLGLPGNGSAAGGGVVDASGEGAGDDDGPAEPGASLRNLSRARTTRLVRALGLRVPPERLRLRVLERGLLGPVPADLEAPLEEANALVDQCAVVPSLVLVIENLATFLALPPMPGALALWGQGYRATVLREASWLARVPRILYWGDLDADGLTILSQVRGFLPQVRSVAMDAATLRRWEHLAVPDPGRHNDPARSGPDCLGAAEPPRLTEAEREAWEVVTADGVRLEQERLPWTWALARIEAAARADPATPSGIMGP